MIFFKPKMGVEVNFYVYGIALCGCNVKEAGIPLMLSI